MEIPKLCDSDYRFMTIVWEHEPLPSGKLVKLCKEILNWKKPTTYTTLRKLCEKGFLQNQNTIVTSLISKEEVQKNESNYFMERTFKGSLPAFLAAFMGERKLSEKEADEIQELIDTYRKKGSIKR